MRWILAAVLAVFAMPAQAVTITYFEDAPVGSGLLYRGEVYSAAPAFSGSQLTVRSGIKSGDLGTEYIPTGHSGNGFWAYVPQIISFDLIVERDATLDRHFDPAKPLFLAGELTHYVVPDGVSHHTSWYPSESFWAPIRFKDENQFWTPFAISNLVISYKMASYVPEAATWAMMIVGFGMVGGMLRRRHSFSPLATCH